MNEFLLFATLVVTFGAVLLCYRFLGKGGLFAFTAVATVLANIEVLILICAFGFEQTLGNVLFASTFLITDILSENESKSSAVKAVFIGLATSVFMVAVTQSWFLYVPSVNDWAQPHLKELFRIAPRLLAASFIGYAVSQLLDVFLYHAWWKFTEKKTASKKGFLWLRNNGSTLVSQFVNAVVFNFIAFWGVYDTKTVLSIVASSYIIYVATSLLDTPCVYIARRIKEKRKIKNA